MSQKDAGDGFRTGPDRENGQLALAALQVIGLAAAFGCFTDVTGA